MKIFSASQLHEADSATIAHKDITSTELMEFAATQAFHWILTALQPGLKNLRILCGIGNNGGDGLVLARLLSQARYEVTVYVLAFSEEHTADFDRNLKRLQTLDVKVVWLHEGDTLPTFLPSDWVVDAIFGIGLNRGLTGWLKSIVQLTNTSGAYVISIDMPSGLFSEKIPEEEEAIVQSDHTLTFQSPKLTFFLPQTGKFVKDWTVLDIGLDEDFLSQLSPLANFVQSSDANTIYRPRARFSHKGTYGHAYIVGGSYGKIGAVALASKACLSAGAGLTSVFVPECGYEVLQSTVPEAMVITDQDKRKITDISVEERATVVGLGVGLGTAPETAKAFEKFLNTNTSPLVIDADGLNLLSKDSELLSLLPPKTILTPHPKELERLIGTWRDDIDKLEKVKAFSRRHDVVVIIKGAYSKMVHENKLYINGTGNPGMATAGSGDVLTGILTGLLAQGYDALEATVLGVYLHGRAGDLAVETKGQEALLASDIVSCLGRAFKELA